MSLFDKAREAHEHASQCTNRGCHATAAALLAAVDAQARQLLAEFGPSHDTAGIPTPEESGYVSAVLIPRPGTEN